MNIDALYPVFEEWAKKEYHTYNFPSESKMIIEMWIKFWDVYWKEFEEAPEIPLDGGVPTGG